MRKFFRLLPPLLLGAAMVVLILCAPAVRTAAVNTLRLCAAVLVPSLFPFCVLSGLFLALGYGALTGRLLGGWMQRLFRLPACGAAALCWGLVGGYPIGALTVAELYRRRELTKQEAEQLSAFCCNAGPAFIVGAAGLPLFGSVQAGLLLTLIHALSAVLTGLLLRGKHAARKSVCSGAAALPFAQALSRSVSDACLAMLRVCGFVVLFGIMLELLLSAPFVRALPPLWKGILSGAVELSTGCARLQGISGRLLFPVVSALLGWGGCCVYFQSASILTASGLCCKPYLRGKLLQMLISLALAYPAVFL